MKIGSLALSLFLGGACMVKIVDANHHFAMQYPCTVVQRIVQVRDDSADFEYDCELDPRDTDGKIGVKVCITDHNGNAHGRDFDCGGPGCQSGVTKMYLDNTNIVGDTNDEENWIIVEEEEHVCGDGSHHNVPVKCVLPPDQTPGFMNNGQGQQGRKLMSPEERSTLVVRVSAPDSPAIMSVAEMSDEVFGTNGDPVNLRSQMQACSYGATQITPATGSVITDGVVDISIDINAYGEAPLVVANAVTLELNEVLNAAGLDTIMYDHVMYCLPRYTRGSWIAFAYLNDNLSVYNDEACGFVSVQMHEIGHNLGLDHSGDSRSSYGDRTGYMGLSYGYDDVPEMCFNAPKSWELGWYGGPRSLELADVTSTGSFSWSGTLVGISDFNNVAGMEYVILKIPQATSSQSLYVNFNRVSGINKSTQEHQDRVLVTTQADTGQSTIRAALTIGQSYVENNFDGNVGNNFAITVNDIDFSTSPWTADVSIVYGSDVQGFNEYARVPTNLTMEEKWVIAEPYFQYDNLDFQLDFNVSDYVNEEQVDFELYQENDCETPISYGDYFGAAGTALFTRLPTGRSASAYNAKSGAIFLKSVEQNNYYSFGAGTKTFSLGLSLNPEGAEQDSQVYNSNEDGSQRIAQASFCVRFKLLTPDQSIEVNYLETLVYLELDLTDGFSIDTVQVRPKDKRIRTANQVYQVVGYKCKYVGGDGTDGNPIVNAPLTAAEEIEGRNQGSIIRVCVKPDADAELDGIKMRSIDSFSFYRGISNQAAIVDKGPAKNQLTTYYPSQCTGSDVCWFESLLFASFYISPGVVYGAGVASMQFGSRRNLLRGESSGRELQATDDEDVAGAAEFELDFYVQPLKMYGSSGASCVTTSVWVACFLAVLPFVSA